MQSQRSTRARASRHRQISISFVRYSLAALVAVSLGAAASAQQIDAELLAFARNFEQERFYTLRQRLPDVGDIAREHDGWLGIRCEVRESADPPIAVWIERQRIVPGGIVSHDEIAFELRGDGRVLWARTRVQQGDVEWSAEARRVQDGTMRRTRRTPNGVEEDEIPQLRDTLRSRWSEVRAHRAGELTEQVHYTTMLFEDEAEEVVRDRRIEEIDRSKFGDGYGMVGEVAGAERRRFHARDGTLIAWQHSEWRGELSQRAAAMSFAGVLAPVFLEIPDPESVTRMKLVWRDCGIERWRQTHRQTWRVREDGAFEFDLRSDSVVADEHAKALTADERRLYTTADEYVTSTDPRIVELATQIVEGEHGAVEIARALMAAVRARMSFTTTRRFRSASEVFDRKEGDCKDHSVLFVALARAADLPARVVDGYMYDAGCTPASFSGHIWAEVHDGRQWISVDVPFEQVFVAATRLALGHGVPEQLTTLESLDLTIESFELAK